MSRFLGGVFEFSWNALNNLESRSYQNLTGMCNENGSPLVPPSLPSLKLGKSIHHSATVPLDTKTMPAQRSIGGWTWTMTGT